MRRRIYAALAALAVAVSALLATGGAAQAGTSGELYLTGATGWCATVLNYNAGSDIALGVCAGASTQGFHLVTSTSGLYEIVSNASGLCVTYPHPNGYPDGGLMESGNCAGAKNQVWEILSQIGGGYAYVDPYRYDSGGYLIAIDDAHSYTKVYNPIDGSYFYPGIWPETWSLL